MTHYTTALVRADRLEGQVAKINGTWSFVYGCYDEGDVRVLADEFDDQDTIKKITDIVSKGSADIGHVYVAVRYLYTNTVSYPGPNYRQAASTPSIAIAAYSQYELVEIQVPVKETGS